MGFYMPVALSSPDPERGVMDRKIKAVVFVVAFSTLCLLIPGIFPTIEIAGGLKGKTIFTEVYFCMSRINTSILD
ncbi:uncharacterized protein ARMOST_20617 [Armillaria ostoyae]|uniref:Uncharacterized protein n=1 Tax=Armillaria ostoyae TaxID=47428 RepID=A0A284S7T3_ARMOS|nr:uncharacterized protein ARMOST_20617 [Armillaria ostoyae]